MEQSWTQNRSQQNTSVNANLAQLIFCYADFNHSGRKWFHSDPNALRHCPGDGGSRRWGITGTSGWGRVWTLHPQANTLTIRSICHDYHLLLRLCLQRQRRRCTEPIQGTLCSCLFWQSSSLHHFLPLHLFYFSLSCYSSPQGEGPTNIENAVPQKQIG